MNHRYAKPDPDALRILGIDPGLADTGWGILDHNRQTGRSVVVDFGVIRTAPALALPERLAAIHAEISRLCDRARPAVVSIEQLYFAKNVKTAMVVAHGRAAAMLATAGRDIELHEYTPLQIKQALTGHGRAAKAQVQQMVRTVLGLTEVPRPDHAADALAAALTHAHLLAYGDKVDRATNAALQVDGEHDEDPRKLLLTAARARRRRRR